MGQRIGDREISDHCPLWLVKEKCIWVPNPFKVNNVWFSHKNFMPFIEREWKKNIVEGRGYFVLKEKLHILKGRIIWRNMMVFGKINLEVEEQVKEINFCDEVLGADGDGLNEEVVGKRKEACNQFWLTLTIKENMLIQKARLKWLNNGDNNNKYFHWFVKERRRHNHICVLNSNGRIVDSVRELKEQVFSNFPSKFVEQVRSRPSLEGNIFNIIKDTDSSIFMLSFYRMPKTVIMRSIIFKETFYGRCRIKERFTRSNRMIFVFLWRMAGWA